MFNPEGQRVFFSKMKAFKLREDIRLYTGENIGALKRKGMKKDNLLDKRLGLTAGSLLCAIEGKQNI